MKLLISDVQPGDQVVLRCGQNYLEGEVVHEAERWLIHAFDTKIEFARDGKNGLSPRMRPRIHLVGHTAQLINEAGD